VAWTSPGQRRGRSGGIHSAGEGRIARPLGDGGVNGSRSNSFQRVSTRVRLRRTGLGEGAEDEFAVLSLTRQAPVQTESKWTPSRPARRPGDAPDGGPDRKGSHSVAGPAWPWRMNRAVHEGQVAKTQAKYPVPQAEEDEGPSRAYKARESQVDFPKALARITAPPARRRRARCQFRDEHLRARSSISSPGTTMTYGLNGDQGLQHLSHFQKTAALHLAEFSLKRSSSRTGLAIAAGEEIEQS